MSDLISKKAVLEYLSELCNTKDISAYGLQLMGNYTAMKSKLAERDLVKGIIENIYGFECAYDVDKIVEQMVTGSVCVRVDDEPFIMLDEAIEIVKGAIQDE